MTPVADAPSAIDAVTYRDVSLTGRRFEVLLDGRPMGIVWQRPGEGWKAQDINEMVIGVSFNGECWIGATQFDSREAAAEALL